MPSLSRRAVAEALGTLAIVYVGAGAMLVNNISSAGYGTLGVALAQALVLGVMVTLMMDISGGHLNPAVSLSMVTTRRLDLTSGIVYIGAQMAGAVLGALLLKWSMPGNVTRAAALGTPLIAGTVTLGQAIFLEAVFSFFLVSAYYGTMGRERPSGVGGFAVGLTLFFGILVGGPLTGAALNPARAFGPAMVSGTWTGQAVYWAGPVIGALIAGAIWSWLAPAREPRS